MKEIENEIENDNEKVESTNNPETEKKGFGSKFGKFLLKHIVKIILILIIIIVYIWAQVRIKGLDESIEAQRIEITNRYESKIDSLTVMQMELTAKTFSWAIRSEMQRGNSEQVEQFFNEFIKNTNIVKLQYVNAVTNVIDLSTNKKEEGDLNNSDLARTDVPVTAGDSLNFSIATPIMGLNAKLGTLIIEVNK